MSTCESTESVVGVRSTTFHFDVTRFYASVTATADRSTSSQSTSPECSQVSDDDAVPVDWTSLRLLFVVLDTLLLAHRLTKLYVELARMPVVGQLTSTTDGYADCRHVSVLPVDGVDPVQIISDLGNHVGSEGHLSGDDDDEGSDGGCCVVSHSLANSTRRRSTGSRSTRRRRTWWSSSDIVPRLVCLTAMLAALFYARTWTMSRGVLWLYHALPSLNDKSPSISTSAIGRHLYDQLGVASLSADFRQLQAFVDFFNRGKSTRIYHETVLLT